MRLTGYADWGRLHSRLFCPYLHFGTYVSLDDQVISTLGPPPLSSRSERCHINQLIFSRGRVLDNIPLGDWLIWPYRSTVFCYTTEYYRLGGCVERWMWFRHMDRLSLFTGGGWRALREGVGVSRTLNGCGAVRNSFSFDISSLGERKRGSCQSIGRIRGERHDMTTCFWVV